MSQIIAIPVEKGMLCQHFGHCETFYFASIENGVKVKEWSVEPPMHEPGLYPVWVREQGAEIVIAGGMGKKACDLFKENGIAIYAGAASQAPETVIKTFLDKTISFSRNVCENHVHTCK